MKPRKPLLRIQPTTLWEYPSQDYGDSHQGLPGYKGATPSYIIWNLLQRYTQKNDLVIDPVLSPMLFSKDMRYYDKIVEPPDDPEPDHPAGSRIQDPSARR